MLKWDIKLAGAFNALDEIAERAAENLPFAAFQGVELLRDEVARQAPRSRKTHYFVSRGAKNADGSRRRYEFNPGDLKKSVVAYRDDKESIKGERLVYRITWRASEGVAAKYGGGSKYRAVPYGYMVHFGTKAGVRPDPFVLRAYEVMHERAEQKVADTLLEKTVGS